jgi:hypothetical protein
MSDVPRQQRVHLALSGSRDRKPPAGRCAPRELQAFKLAADFKLLLKAAGGVRWRQLYGATTAESHRIGMSHGRSRCGLFPPKA